MFSLPEEYAYGHRRLRQLKPGKRSSGAIEAPWGRLVSTTVTSLVLCLALSCPCRPCFALPPPRLQHFYLPLDISSGVAFNRGEPRPFELSARITPSFNLADSGRVRLGAQAVGYYHNPEWFFGYGPSIAFQVWHLPLKEVGVLLIADHMWYQGDRPSSGLAAVFDADGIFRIGLRVDRDWLEESTAVQGTFGADIPSFLILTGIRKVPSDHFPQH